MPLPFSDDKGKRKYQCFVCGIMFSDFATYRDHILDKHEEGREYVVCPLAHCKAPIRCLPTHFKCKHPGIPMPKIGQQKAIIWKDFNPKQGKKGQTHKPRFREGWYESTKMGKSLHYRSGYEAKIYEYLDCDVEVNAFDVEPFEIEYIHKGKSHKYVPDIIVHFIDGRTEVLEIKPASQTLLEKNQNKWHAATRACKARGWEFVVITEIGIDKWKNKVLLQREYAKINQ
jgi:hypothetical protein